MEIKLQEFDDYTVVAIHKTRTRWQIYRVVKTGVCAYLPGMQATSKEIKDILTKEIKNPTGDPLWTLSPESWGVLTTKNPKFKFAVVGGN